MECWLRRLSQETRVNLLRLEEVNEWMAKIWKYQVHAAAAVPCFHATRVVNNMFVDDIPGMNKITCAAF